MNLSFIKRWLLGILATGIIFFIGRGLSFDSIYAAIMIALLLGLANAALPYFISMMTFMQSVLTLGLATLIVNILLLSILQSTHLGIHFASFDAMLMIAIMISVLAWFTTMAMDAPLKNSSNGAKSFQPLAQPSFQKNKLRPWR